MNEYIWFTEDYMGKKSDAELFGAASDEDAIIAAMLLANNDLTEEELIEDLEDRQGLIQYFIDTNGDGQPYVTIKNVNTNEIIFGG